MKYEIRSATQEDIEYVADHLRESDKKEIWASHRRWPLEIPKVCHGVECFSACADGIAFCIFGCQQEGDRGVPWLLATESVHTHSLWFLRASRRICSDWLKKYQVLTNLMHSENDACFDWLVWLKFSFPEYCYINGEKFLRFEKRCKL